MYKTCVFAAVCMLLTAGLAGAQETTTGSIAGRVTDAQGLAVPGAAVTVITPQGPQSFTTDANGAFFAPFLTPGTYEVKVELQGFRGLDRQNVDVRLGQRVELTLPLQVGALTDSVSVS
ncbi:MAG TPA: carboxypeptidase-like regulatory domain-containing protein, partial [Vicinamibacterales bacterium]|nr:carboxypeptidase-like regulatory domain-containing protein [Vicinamibacterales bacterium]